MTDDRTAPAASSVAAPTSSIDPATFRAVLGRFASGVTVVTMRDEAGHDHGMTVSAFCSVSLDPPLVLACIDRAASMFDALTVGGAYAINVLSDTQEPLSRRFATDMDDRFEGVGYMRGPRGSPLLDDALDLAADARPDRAETAEFVDELLPAPAINRGLLHRVDERIPISRRNELVERVAACEHPRDVEDDELEELRRTVSGWIDVANSASRLVDDRVVNRAGTGAFERADQRWPVRRFHLRSATALEWRRFAARPAEVVTLQSIARRTRFVARERSAAHRTHRDGVGGGDNDLRKCVDRATRRVARRMAAMPDPLAVKARRPEERVHVVVTGRPPSRVPPMHPTVIREPGLVVGNREPRSAREERFGE